MKARNIIILSILFIFFTTGDCTNYRRVLEENTVVEEAPAHKTTKTPNPTAEPLDSSTIILKNIKVWTPILLFVTVVAAIYFTAGMEIPKNTLLYASYVTNKVDKIN